MATTAATKNQGRPRGAGNGKAADVKDIADKTLTAPVSEVGGMKVDRSLEKRVDHISSEEAERQGKTARVAVRGRSTPPGHRRPGAGARSTSSLSRPPRESPTWCRSATGG